MADVFSTEMLTKQYSATLDILSQERMKLLPHIWDKGTVQGAEQYWNQADAFELVHGRSENADTSTTLVTPTYQRRRCMPKWESGAILTDDITNMKSLADPRSTISQQGIRAAARAKDRICWNAVYGTAYTGVAGGTAVPFDTNMIVDVQEGGSSSDVGMNVAKITKAIELIALNSVDIDQEDLTLFIAPAQRTDCLNIENLTSHDYMMGRSLATGKLDGIAGINRVIVTNMVPYTNAAGTGANVDLSGSDLAWATGGKAIDVDSTGYRACALIASSGVAFASWGETKVRITERADLNHVSQFFIEVKAGATRMEEGKVVLIECQE